MVSIGIHSQEHTLGNIVVDVINFDTQPRNIVVDKIIRHTLGNIVRDGIYCDDMGNRKYIFRVS